MASFLHSYERRRKNIAVFRSLSSASILFLCISHAILSIPKYASNCILRSSTRMSSNIFTFRAFRSLNALSIYLYRNLKSTFRPSGTFDASKPTTVYVRAYMCARADDIGDYIKRVIEKERNSRSIMKPEPRCMHLAERLSPDAVDRR